MRLATLATMMIGAAAGYFGARTLMDSNRLPEQLPEQLPRPLRERLESARTRLRRARSDAMEVLAEVEQVRAAAEQELTEDYLRRVGRCPAAAERSDDEPAETAAEAPSQER